jgi:hypothetical protein
MYKSLYDLENDVQNNQYLYETWLVQNVKKVEFIFVCILTSNMSNHL